MTSYKKFNKLERFEIMNNALKVMLNSIPFRLADALKEQHEFNLFDNLEILKGQTKCDYIYNNPSVLKESITAEAGGNQQSYIEEFLSQIPEQKT